MTMMMNDSHRSVVRKHGTLVGRILIGILFLSAGFSKLTGGIAGTAGYIASVGLPMPELLAILAMAIEIVGGALLILGYRVGWGAGLLVLFTLVTVIFFHGPGMWADDPMQQTMFMKNVAIMGGLLYILAYGAGEGWALGKKKAAPPQAETTV